MNPDSDEYYCFQWCGRMRWVCVRNTTGRDCKWVLARRLGQIVPGRVGSWGEYQQQLPTRWNRNETDPSKLKRALKTRLKQCLTHPKPQMTCPKLIAHNHGYLYELLGPPVMTPGPPKPQIIFLYPPPEITDIETNYSDSPQ
jgi:hypothetical protein